MTDSIFATLLNAIDGHTAGDVARALGQPEQSVRRGMESSVAAVFSSLAAKSNDSGALQRIIDMLPSTGGQAYWSQMAGTVSDPNSSLMAAGRRMLPALFGSGENAVTNGISRASSLSPSAVTTLLSMAGPIVMSFIAKQLRDGAMTMEGLRGALQRESTTIRNALPTGLSDVFWPATPAASTTSPVIAQSVHRERSANWILPAIIAGAVALGLVWLLGHARRPMISRVTPAPTGEASRAAPPAAAVCTMPATVVLPQDGLGSRFLAFVQTQPSPASEFDADQLSFATGSARLTPQAQAQLNGVATVLVNCPNVRVKVAGYTDNVGNPAPNLSLSRNRAINVVSQLERSGVSADRITAEGDGDHNPIADNASPEGRAKNRRVAIFVLQPQG
jgi:OmpA-OmpF porin, OOP family